ncbi:hypothetical protein cypCar_00024821 [Cyprinus carpio]|nr:hypothetical protein cypCar_00024821 [Cyprinus carpio]
MSMTTRLHSARTSTMF